MPDDLEPVPNAPGFYRPRRDALAPVTAVSLGLPPRIGGMATSGEINARVHSVPTVTRRRETPHTHAERQSMETIPAAPLGMRVVEIVMTHLTAATATIPSGDIDTERTAEILRRAVIDAITVADLELHTAAGRLASDLGDLRAVARDLLARVERGRGAHGEALIDPALAVRIAAVIS